jgi:hypothetical protein
VFYESIYFRTLAGGCAHKACQMLLDAKGSRAACVFQMLSKESFHKSLLLFNIIFVLRGDLNASEQF